MSETTDVTLFHRTFNLPVRTEPTLLGPAEEALRVGLIEEELEELKEALFLGDMVEVFDALVDLKYVITGMGVAMGLPMDRGWDEVQRSNMSKLDRNGRPIFRADGKILKGPNFSEPDLKGVLGDYTRS